MTTRFFEEARRRPFGFVLAAVLSLFAIAGGATLRADAVTEAEQGPGSGDTIWLANRDAGTVTVVEAATGRTIRTLTSGAGAHDIAVSARAGKVYVMNELEDRIAVFSASTLERLNTISVPRPHHAKASLDGRFVYVGLFNNNRIAAIETSSDAVYFADSSRNINARAHAPRPSTGNRFVFVPHEVGDEVTAIDATTGELVGSILPGSRPTAVLSPAGQRVYATFDSGANGIGGVAVVSAQTGAKVATWMYPGVGRAHGIAYSTVPVTVP